MISKNSTLFFAIITIIGSVCFSCNQNKIFDDYSEIPSGVWSQDSLVNFNFNVPKNSVDYSINYNIRYAISYPYYNLYISYYLEDSVGNIISTELQEIILFDKKTGEPIGDGLGDLYDLKVESFKKVSFPYSGEYKFKVKQFMRTNDLSGIMSFGLMVDKLKD